MKNARVLTINFWGTEPPIERRIELAVRQLRALAPDVICMQEVKPYGEATTAHAIAAALGMTAAYRVSTKWSGPTGDGEEGLAIIAKTIHEVRAITLPEPRPLETRILLSAQVETVGGPIWVHTTHLHYRLDDGIAREQQVLAVDEAVRNFGRGNTDAPQILCGDFNATPDSDEIRFLRGLTTLGGRRTHFQDAWLRRYPDQVGITWSSENELTRPLRSLDIDRRIDFVFVTSRKKDGRGTVHDARVCLDERETVDGHGSICASDHYAVLADVQVAANEPR